MTSKTRVSIKILRMLFVCSLLFLLTGCQNKLEKDLKEARKAVEKSERQEQELADSEYLEGLIPSIAYLEEMISNTGTGDDSAEDGAEGKEDSKEENKKDSRKEESDFGDILSGEYAQMLKGGQYYMEYTSYIWGMEGKGRTAASGQNTDTISEMMGFETRTMVLDGFQYDFDAAQKKYTKTEISEIEDYMESNSMDYSSMEFVGSGNGEIPGMDEVLGYEGGSYDYDEFQIIVSMPGYGEETGDMSMTIPIRIYVDKNGIVAVYAQTMGIDTVMMIEEFSRDIPSDMFVFPSDYTEVDSLY